MTLEANAWQPVPGSASVDIFPILAKPSIVSSNCYILSAPEAIVVIDPGANPVQTRQINQILIDALAFKQRPVLVFLTHCHQDHSQEAGSFNLPIGTEIKWFAHEAGVEALSRGDRKLTVAYLYPWHPEICRVQFDGKLFDATKGFEAEVFAFASGASIELKNEPITTSNGTEIKHQWLPLGPSECLSFYHTPGHTPCSISLRIGSLLVLGDLPFAANPGLCGLDGWNHADLLETLHKVDWLLENQGITVCCLGHGYCVSAPSMREKLRLMEYEARGLADVDLMNSDRIGSLKSYVDELLEEMAVLFTILSGRLYTASYYLSVLEEDVAAQRVLATFDLDQIDRILSEFRRFVDAFNDCAAPELSVVLKGVQVARSLQQLLSVEIVQQLLDVSLVGRAQRLLVDFLGVSRGLQFLNAEIPGSLNELIERILRRARSAREQQSADLMGALDDEQSFVAALSRRLASHSPLRDIELIFTPTDQRTDTIIGADRLDDILTSLIEGMAVIGARQVRISTQALPSQLEIRLTSGQPITPATFGQRRLDLYNRMLGWLGGSLECGETNGSAEFVLRLPALCLIGST